MDLYVALSVVVWAVGGAFSTAMVFWLDRDRLELPFVLKAATLVGWPILLPYLLYQREDLSPWEAGRNAAIWLLVFSPLAVMDMAGSPSAPMGRVKICELPPVPTAPVRNLAFDPLPATSPLPPATAPSENDRREAVRYWNSGIIYYQKGDYEMARDEWTRCKQLDSSNSDCATGLQRIEQSYGSTLVSAVR